MRNGLTPNPQHRGERSDHCRSVAMPFGHTLLSIPRRQSPRMAHHNIDATTLALSPRTLRIDSLDFQTINLGRV